MTTRLAFQVTTLGFLMFSGLRPASATTNFFSPVSGAEFVSVSNSPNVLHAGGAVSNVDTQAGQVVEASLGHAQGGLNGFTVSGTSTAAHLPICSVLVMPESGAAGFSYSAGVSFNNGVFSQFIQTNAPSGNYFYTVSCPIPAKPLSGDPTRIFGIKPDH